MKWIFLGFIKSYGEDFKVYESDSFDSELDAEIAAERWIQNFDEFTVVKEFYETD